MSAQSGEELGSEGKWFSGGGGDDYGRMFGNAAPRFDEVKPRGGEAADDLDRQFHPYQDDGKRPPVAMETASTGDPMSGLFRKPMNDDGDVYTSLLSNQSFTSGLESSYLSDNAKASSGLDRFSSDMYGFSSGTKTVPDDKPESLIGSEKTESYNYMDISHGDDRHERRPADAGSSGRSSLGSYIDRNPEKEEEDEEEDENLGPALGSHSFPYVEEPSDEELSDYRSYRNLGGTPQSASPVKITLTESRAPTSEAEPRPLHSSTAGSDRENVLSVGLQGVPTVTLSEPEDDSPASSPNTSPTQKDFPSRDTVKSDVVKSAPSKYGPGSKVGAKEQDGSSAESGDSEIELVSEEPPRASSDPFAEPTKSKGAFDRSGDPPAAPKTGNHAPPAAYSILREEREAELDSDLFIESASEESPKREQGVGGPDPVSRSPRQPAEPSFAEKMKAEEERPSKPKPPTATVPPEVRPERFSQEDKKGHQSKVDLGKLAASFLLEGFNKQKAIDLLYWRNVKQSGAVFSSVLLLLFSLTQFSVVSVGAYLALAALSATISFRIYKSVLQAVQKTDEGHPFRGYLEMEISLSQDQISKYADKILLYTNTCMKELRRLFLVQDLIDSLKFAVLMWLLTYVGALFNGLTLLILAVVSMFTMPVVYEKHQAQIDQYVGLIRTHVNAVVGKIQAKIPGAKRKEE
ncbi:reticulon-1a isoform X1 [Corythoichthys intestinalis]|uniref:reticulon-1a isoform X1 n=1 Tax=Corythoichthys intestinalis TaxID=161448 RepID=UPI0025A68019|nr:reticulon-1a isoform X1 [Corythoichthys intestinalis]